MMQIQAVVFDFGNVVGFFDHRLTTQRLAAHSALPAEAIHRFLFGGDLEEEYESGRITSAEFLKRVRTACQLHCDEATVAAAWADIFRPNQDVCALVGRMKHHYRLLLGSNTNELHARHFCRQFADTFQHFAALVFSHEVGARKPDAAFFEHCRRLAGCEPQACLFIDDLPANVEGARACGWHGIVYTGFDDLQTKLAKFSITSAK
jgi:putative hydrolase of the HAD superfamily